MSEAQGFEAIIGQDLAKRVLMRAVREQAPAHAYLFLGLEGTGKTMTALAFAKALNCESPVDGDACGQCALCHAMEHSNFPDTRIWSPQGQNTKIEHMREMRELANFGPLRGRWKINIIEQGDTLNDESANCILKLVEEPPPYLINILLYRNAASVLPTIRSRCLLVRFTQANADVLATRLVTEFGAEEEQARFVAAFTQGRPGAAIRLLDNPEFFALRDALIRAAAEAASGKVWSALKLAEVARSSGTTDDEDEDQPTEPGKAEAEGQPKARRKAGARNSVLVGLDILLTWYRDLMATRLGGEDASVVNSDRLSELRAQAAGYTSTARLARAVDAILYARKGILGNANAQIATEAMAIRLVA